MTELLYGDLTEKIIGAAFAVHNALGKGHTEKTYENALAIKLKNVGLSVRQQETLPIFFEEQKVGEQVVDLVVDDLVIVEVKAVQVLDHTHEKQILRYLNHTRFQLGLLINFGSKVDFKRFISML